MKQLFLCLLLGISPCLYAVNNLRLPGVRCMGMGECGVVQSALFNPAVVALDNYKSFDINYFNYYGLKELGTVGMSFSYPNNLLSAGVNISSFGYDRYRESMFRVFLGKSLTENGRSVSVFNIHFFRPSWLKKSRNTCQPMSVSCLFPLKSC